MAKLASNSQLIGLAFGAIIIFLGGNYVAVKFSNVELAPFWGAGLRFSIAALLLLVIAKTRKIALPKGRALKGAVLFGIFAFGLLYGLVYWALLGLGAAATSVIFATIPLITLLMATAVGLERITARGLVAATLVIVGISFIFKDQISFNVPIYYFFLALGGAFCGALSGVIVKYFPKSHPVAINTVAMAVGAVLLLSASLLIGENMKLPSSGATWIALAWLIISSICAFVLMVWVLSKWSASATSYALVIAPLVTIVVAAILLDETITGAFVIGGAIVLAGVYISIFKQPQKAI